MRCTPFHKQTRGLAGAPRRTEQNEPSSHRILKYADRIQVIRNGVIRLSDTAANLRALVTLAGATLGGEEMQVTLREMPIRMVFVLRAIAEDLDLTEHMHDAVRSLQIVLAADESTRTGQVVTL